MSEKIQTRVFQRGDKNESNCISDYGDGKRGRFIWRDGKFIEVSSLYLDTPRKKAPAVHQDSMDPIEHPAEPGRKIDSRSKFRAITRKHGLEELGNERPKPTGEQYKRMSVETIMDDIKKATNDLRWGNAPLTEAERARCREIDRRRNNHG